MTTLFLCHSSEFGHIEGTAGLCRANGYGIEVSDFSEADVLGNADAVGTIAGSMSGISGRALHAPYLGLDPVSADRSVGNRTLEVYRLACETAIQLDMHHIIVHSIYDPSQHSLREWYRKSVAFWRAFLSEAPESVRVHIENVMDSGPEILLDMIRETGMPNCDVNLDIGHARVYSDKPLAVWIRVLGRHIGYVHLHDNHGQADEHIGLGQGSIPLDDVCRMLKDCAPESVWAVESGGIGMTQSLRWLNRHGFIDAVSGLADNG